MRWMPLRVSPHYFQLYTLAWKQPKLYDIGFCGILSPRRHAVILELSKTWKVRHVTAQGPLRDRQLGQCQILLNVHAGPD